MNVDIDAQTWDIDITNLTNPGPAQTASATGLAFNAAAVELSALRFTSIGGVDSTHFTVDNLLIETVIPEPGAVALSLAGLGLMMVRRIR